MLDTIKAEQYLSELEMIRRARVALTQRMIALAKLFDRLVRSITADEKMVFRNFYARFRYLLATLPMRDVEQRNLENFRRLVNEGDTDKLTEKAFEQGVMLHRAVADRIDRRIGGAAQSIDRDAVADRESRVARQRDIGHRAGTDQQLATLDPGHWVESGHEFSFESHDRYGKAFPETRARSR